MQNKFRAFGRKMPRIAEPIPPEAPVMRTTLPSRPVSIVRRFYTSEEAYESNRLSRLQLFVSAVDPVLGIELYHLEKRRSEGPPAMLVFAASSPRSSIIRNEGAKLVFRRALRTISLCRPTNNMKSCSA